MAASLPPSIPSIASCDNYYRKLGQLGFLLTKSDFHLSRSASNTLDRLSVLIDLNQLEVFYNDDGNSVGFVGWIFLSHEDELEVTKRGDFDVLSNFKNSGSFLWVVDFFSTPGHLPYILRSLRDKNFKNERRVRYLRFKEGRLLVKEIERNSSLSFFKGS
jgi:hemolysin-activating ACP:hemolysin acyltransferase